VEFAQLFATVVAVALLLVSAVLFASVVALVWRPHLGRRATQWRGEADQKARALLRHWLSPTQLKQYENTGHFEVVGCDSGRRYRIHRYRQMNIEELNDSGARVAIWCFEPEGHLPIGDMMLAQKIALETNEHAALAIANRGRPS
jgi:hypothetical protein